MPTAWRIVEAGYATQAFDGEGARLHGGRWNSPGTKMVYTSDSPSLATLELLVQIGNPTVLPNFVLISTTFEESLVSRIEPAGLPFNWRSYPAPHELQVLGDQWIRSRSSVILEVPSAVIVHQHNYLLNPEHPDFSALSKSTPQPLGLDLRLLRKK